MKKQRTEGEVKWALEQWSMNRSRIESEIARRQESRRVASQVGPHAYGNAKVQQGVSYVPSISNAESGGTAGPKVSHICVTRCITPAFNRKSSHRCTFRRKRKRSLCLGGSGTTPRHHSTQGQTIVAKVGLRMSKTSLSQTPAPCRCTCRHTNRSRLKPIGTVKRLSSTERSPNARSATRTAPKKMLAASTTHCGLEVMPIQLARRCALYQRGPCQILLHQTRGVLCDKSN
jgi:hypothetical protein